MKQIYMGIDVAKNSFVVAAMLVGKVTTSLYHNNQKGIAGFLFTHLLLGDGKVNSL